MANQWYERVWSQWKRPVVGCIVLVPVPVDVAAAVVVALSIHRDECIQEQELEQIQTTWSTRVTQDSER